MHSVYPSWSTTGPVIKQKVTPDPATVIVPFFQPELQTNSVQSHLARAHYLQYCVWNPAGIISLSTPTSLRFWLKTKQMFSLNQPPCHSSTSKQAYTVYICVVKLLIPFLAQSWSLCRSLCWKSVSPGRFEGPHTCDDHTESSSVLACLGGDRCHDSQQRRRPLQVLTESWNSRQNSLHRRLGGWVNEESSHSLMLLWVGNVTTWNQWF